MPKIIILKTDDQTGTGGPVNLEYLFWLAVKPGQEIPLPTFQSDWLGVTEEQTKALQQGSIIEKRRTKGFQVDLSTPEAKQLARTTAVPGIKARLEQEFAQVQAVENNKISPLQFYGITWDDDGWKS